MSFPRVSTRLSAFLAALAAAVAMPQAEALDVDSPMVEIGGGAAVDAGAATSAAVLLRLKIDNFTVHPGNEAPDYVIARLKGNVALGASREGPRFPYADIEFVPVTIRQGEGISGRWIRVLPGRLGANIDLNQKAVVRVDVAGIERNVMKPVDFDERIMVFAKFAADALGYKMATHVSDKTDFHGANLAAVEFEAGALMALGRFTVRVAFGATADISAGKNTGARWSLRDDVSAYNEISVDMGRFFRLFARNSYLSIRNTGFDTVGEYQLLAGGTFIF